MPTPKLPANPTPKAFASAWRKHVLEVAAKKLAGTDGRISKDEVAKAGTLRGTAKLSADNVADVFAATGAKQSTSVERFLAAGEKHALAAAKTVAGSDGKLSKQEMAAFAKLSADFDWLSAKEVAAAAREIGIVSDLDSTVIPPEANGAMPKPYPGVAALYRELDVGNRGRAGDVRYVTARTPDRVTDIPDYLNGHGVPNGSIDTGTSTLPWVAQPEKVRDISRIFEANPDQKFVLFGDSKHKDPEVYREIAAKYPNQVTAIFIHKVNDTVSPARVQGMHLIHNYAEAAAQLLRAGVLSEAAARRVMNAAKADGLALTSAEINALINANR